MEEFVNIIENSRFSILYYKHTRDKQKLLSLIRHTRIEDNGFNFLSAIRNKKLECLINNEPLEKKLSCEINSSNFEFNRSIANFDNLLLTSKQMDVENVRGVPMLLSTRADLILFIENKKLKIIKNRFGNEQIIYVD